MKLKLLLCAMLGSVVPMLASAQAFPSKTITIVVGGTAGSATDGLARAIAQEITTETKTPVIIENKPGANGAIAAQMVARAAPDGYTVFMTTNTTQAANPHLYKKLPYDPVKDFAPVGAIAKGYLVMVTKPDLPAKSIGDVINLAKKEPGKLSFGAGTSSSRVAVELVQQMTGAELLYVPYKANPPAVTDLIGGQIDMMIVDLAATMSHVKSGKLKALGVTSPKRSALAPELPTLSESGLPGYEMSYWNALYAPAGTSPATVKRLNELLTKATQTESVRKFMNQTGMEIYTSTPEGLASFQTAEFSRWGSIIKKAGIQPE
ncbi:Bug family tripartite tricarboxylate transporter substrate binding protein [Noviherbaspirillum malthae]|jgi:tripartite-type tricarboxylate transporter receptor subunit TctC|uniref:Bug family tripartite tricarboxylate transporter substrate binding protein n=1 Tax=Noviherbaspirillum malthae TaxID=1260987 RepID=UPI00188E6293|nr:tripartite tricarboxylate transporter substrate binding protein [Noviherbaspirillum malthae]